jgi:hypothetical protein
MSQQVINVGNIPNDGSGDPIRVAFQKTNNNFTELFNIGGISGIANGTSNIQIALNSTVGVSAAGVSNVLVVSGTGATVQGTLLANSTVTATGNVESGGFFIGDGSLLTGVVSSPLASQLTGNTLSPNVVNSSLTSVGVLTSLSVSGAVTGGNIISPGTISASGNIVGLNLNTAGVASVAGNVTGGNLTTAGSISAVGNIDTAGNITAGFFIGDGSLLSGISAGTGDAGQLTGTTLSANVVNSTLQTVGNLNNLIVSNALGGTGNIVSNNISVAASVSAAGNITGGNITSLGSANVVTLNVLGTAFAGNISALAGNIEANNIQFTGSASGTSISVTGNISAAAVSAAGNISTTANISATNLIGTVSTPTQNLITSVGILTSLSVTGNINSGNLSTGNISAAGSITGVNISAGGSVQSASMTVTGNVQGGNVTTPGQVSAAGNVSGNNLALLGAANIGGDVLGANLTLSGTAIVGGNLVVNGNTVYTNVDNLAIEDPIISIGRGPNSTPLITNDGKDRGEAMYYFDTAERIGFIGYQVSTGKLIAARIVNINNEQITVSQYGTMRVGTLESDAVSAIGNVQAGNVSASNAIQTASLTATGNIVGGNSAVSGAASVNSLTASTTISAAGTITGGNIAASGNLTALNITSSNNTSTTSLTVSGNTATVTTANYVIGYRDIPQKTTFGTLVTTDGGKHYYGSGTLTLPTDASVPLAVGTTILVVATGATTISPAAGVTLRQAGTSNTGARSLAANGMATIIKVETNIWYINGTGVS